MLLKFLYFKKKEGKSLTFDFRKRKNLSGLRKQKGRSFILLNLKKNNRKEKKVKVPRPILHKSDCKSC